MEREYYSIIKELSRIHIVPYHKWNNKAKKIIKDLLGDIPYFITHNGSIFIGEECEENIKSNKICLQAHLDHPGGRLYYSKQQNYMYCKFYGQSSCQKLIGRKFGAFTLGKSKSINNLEVEHCNKNSNDYITLFFKPNKEIMKEYESGDLVIHYNSSLVVDESIKNWNLDDILNSALIIYLLKDKKYRGHYGLLTINEEVDHSGIYEFLNITIDKNLYFISMDTIYDESNINNDFGIRIKQGRVKLDKFIPNNFKNNINEKYKGKIPFGESEAITLTKENASNIGLFVKIKNFHNGIPFKKFQEEEIHIEVFNEYINFVKYIVDSMDMYLTLERLKFFKVSKDKLKINIRNYCNDIRDIILECRDYTDYLIKGAQNISDIFSKYNLNIPNMNNHIFYNCKKNLENKEIMEIDKMEVEEIVGYLLDNISNLFDIEKDDLFNYIKDIDISQIILGNFNACNIFHPRPMIILSNDQIRGEDIERVMTHELTHYITRNIWRGINLPGIAKTYYDEGLAIYLSAKKCKLTIREALTLKEDEYVKYMGNIEKLREWFLDYLRGNNVSFYKGNIHEYFIEKQVPHPFYANTKEMPRYGYFLGALETKRMIEGGNYYEKLLCK